MNAIIRPVFCWLIVMMHCSLGRAEGDGRESSQGVYRHSYWYTKEVLYLQDELALVRNVRELPSGTVEIWFNLGRHSWGGQPELSGETGDIEKEKLFISIQMLGVDEKSGLLFGRGEIAPSGEMKYFVIPYNRVDAISLFEREEEIGKRLGRQVKAVEFRSPDIIFRWLVDRLKGREKQLGAG
jgi:hypothetical protein